MQKFLKVFVFFAGILLFWFCSSAPKNAVQIRTNIHSIYLKISENQSPICYFEALMKKNQLVEIQTLIPDIHVDLKYSHVDNFMGFNMYGCLTKAYLLPHVTQQLANCQNYLKELHPGYSLIVYDAARPLQVQRIMWDSLDLPAHEKIKYLSNPWLGSLHNYGAAVDVSILDETGNPLDMGTPFDYIGEESHPSLEVFMVQQGKLTKEHVENRQLLRSVMRKGGFWGIPAEWWHFNAMTREYASEHFKLIQ